MLRGLMRSAVVLAALLCCAWPEASFAEGGAVACKLIRNVDQLQAMRNDLAGSYCLARDIDAGSMENFVPVGTSDARFTGKFFGNGYVISNLTIESAREYVGLFGIADDALIRDVGLANARVTSTKGNAASVGGLLGSAQPGTAISRVHVTGSIRCRGCSWIGGIVGALATDSVIAESWSSARVAGPDFSRAGGAVGFSSGEITRTHATGPVTCGDNCKAGGLAGASGYPGIVDLSFATGPVTVGDSTEGDSVSASAGGGLLGRQEGNISATRRSYAAGPVTGGAGAYVGGLIGQMASDLTQGYAVGHVDGESGFTGGLIGQILGSPIVMDAYWDTQTSGQTTSAGGLGGGLMTTGFRAELPPGFDDSWAITKTRSYPFLNDFDLDLASPLATLVRTGKVFVFVPIRQLDPWEYKNPPLHADAASQAALFAIIARAIGVAKDIAALKKAKISRYWDDASQTATWQGEVALHATLGTLKPIAAGARLDGTNVIGAMQKQKLVILRGTFTTASGASATHWMLGTLFTKDNSDKLGAVVAHDPWSGRQVMIDPATKKVFSPASFPLAKFRVNGYRQVTLN